MMLKELSNDQLNKIADICSDIALLFLASVGLPAVLDKFSIISAFGGLFTAIFFLILSLKILRIKSLST